LALLGPSISIIEIRLKRDTMRLIRKQLGSGGRVMKRMLSLTTPHMTGDDVKYAQTLLKRAGYYKSGTGGEFGPLTAQACYRAKYWLGYAKPDQTFGSSLEKLLLGKAQPAPEAQKRITRRKKQAQLKPLREKALAQMQKFVGLAEEPAGSNHVPAINSWWGQGDAAWCARTVSKAYILAGSKAFTRGGKYQYVPTLVGDARAGRNGLAVTLDPQPGDLVCYDWHGNHFTNDDNHVGMFVSGTKSSFKAIEGNISSKCDFQSRSSRSASEIVFVHVGK
jgi:peptidoglycan hydrolase-like protein with peptidoglycan-binding domain